MPFTIDYLGDGEPLAWSLTGTADAPDWTVERRTDYRPSLYAVAAAGMRSTDPDPAACRERLASLADALEDHPIAVASAIERARPGYRFAAQPVLRIEADREAGVRELATWIERRGPPGQVPYRAFDVDFTPEFRFCLDRDVSPKPPRSPTVLHLDLPRKAAADEDLTALSIGTEARTGASPTQPNRDLAPAGATDRAALETLRERLRTADPDVLVVERGEIVPLVADAAAERGIDLGLRRVPPEGDAGEIPPYQRLAGASTFESYGQIRHSPARYNVPGRVLIDRSNTFFFTQTNLAGCLDLVERSAKPLQELAWASIGNVLTAIQIREARRRNVLVQWRAWRPERFKRATKLHAGDRGGTTLSPIVGFHEDVYELDFASLYPNIICEYNLSPDTVRCSCHDRADVPELGYSVCDRDGFLPDVLQPIVDDRAAMKERLADARSPGGANARDREPPQSSRNSLSPAEVADLEGQISALKWILVSCFGYQGFSNAKFGRIEVHEAINAHARDILLTAKEHLEAGGWRVLHGIVDSLWVTPQAPDGQRRPIEDVAADVSDEVHIALEYEGAFDWVAFCPLRDGSAGALTRYFGRRRTAGDDDAGEDRYKRRGIECRQRSTCDWVADVQRDLLRALDEYRAPEPVCDRLRGHLRDLEEGTVSPADLIVTTRASKDVDEYVQRNRTVAALERAGDLDIPTHPGQDVRYVVTNDDRDSMDRVRLAAELDAETTPDVTFYRTQAIRAAESILSPLGWDRSDVRAHLQNCRDSTLAAFDRSAVGDG